MRKERMYHAHGSWIGYCLIGLLAVLPSIGRGELAIIGPSEQPITSGAPADFAQGTDFGNHAPGSAVTHTFTLRNTGTDPIDVTGSRIRGGRRFGVNLFSSLIAPGASQDVEITFRPDTAFVHTGELQIFIADHDPIVLNLAGSSFAVDPDSGPSEGGNRVTIVGAFPDDLRVTDVSFAGQPATFRHGGGLLRRDRSILTVTAPAAPHAGPADIVIETEAHGSLTLSAAYVFIEEEQGDDRHESQE